MEPDPKEEIANSIHLEPAPSMEEKFNRYWNVIHTKLTARKKP
jgi:hypothetical protein